MNTPELTLLLGEEEVVRKVEKRYPKLKLLLVALTQRGVERKEPILKINENSCWVWLKYKTPAGYGRLTYQTKVFRAVHRFFYENLIGPIPSKLTLDHLCRNRSCVNPDHLEPVSRGENVLRGEGITAINARKTHCKRGHAFDEKNTYKTKVGRMCRACDHNHYLKRRENERENGS